MRGRHIPGPGAGAGTGGEASSLAINGPFDSNVTLTAEDLEGGWAGSFDLSEADLTVTIPAGAAEGTQVELDTLGYGRLLVVGDTEFELIGEGSATIKKTSTGWVVLKVTH